jgi:hypothetical protein
VPRFEIGYIEVDMTVRCALCVVVALTAFVTPGRAHHSFAAEFDASQPVTLHGTLTKLDWINPHGWIFLDVKGADGGLQHWEIETAGPTQLMRRGMRKTDFPIGVELVITGFKARKQPFVAAARSVKRTDGAEYFVNAQGTGAPN